MLKEAAVKYYKEQGMNCAESLSRAANDIYDLNMNEDIFHTIGGFGGGCYAGRMCGACTGSVAAISKKYILTKAHSEQDACDRVKEFVNAFIETLGTDICKELKEKYFDPELRCQKTVELAAEVLEKKMNQYLEEDKLMEKMEKTDCG